MSVLPNQAWLHRTILNAVENCLPGIELVVLLEVFQNRFCNMYIIQYGGVSQKEGLPKKGTPYF